MFDDPLAVRMLPDDNARRQSLPILLSALARYCTLFGEVHTLGTPLSACAIWLPPGETEMTPDRMKAAGMADLADRFGPTPFARFSAVMDHMGAVHDSVIPGDHWYLQVIGIDPTHQRSGQGAALLTPVLARADSSQYPCFLETFAGNTVPYYQRFGFQVVAAGKDPAAQLDYWAMRRDPA